MVMRFYYLHDLHARIINDKEIYDIEHMCPPISILVSYVCKVLRKHNSAPPNPHNDLRDHSCKKDTFNPYGLRTDDRKYDIDSCSNDIDLFHLSKKTQNLYIFCNWSMYYRNIDIYKQ